MVSVGTKGVAPYKNVLTHGFILDESGYKLSKSSGNALNLDKLFAEYGADILRLWTVSSDYMEDLKIGKDIIKHQEDMYRRLRNTLRYLLGNLEGVSSVEEISYENLPELEKWVLHRIAEIDKSMRARLDNYGLHAIFKEIYAFAAVDLSAFYFDIRKDVLYCDGALDNRYKSVLFVLDRLFYALCNWLSPILVFTAEEAWQTRFGDESSVHLETFLDIPLKWYNASLGKKWQQVKAVRRIVTTAIEKERAAKVLGSSLQAHVDLYVMEGDLFEQLRGLPLHDIAITSTATLHRGEGLASSFRDEEFPEVAVSVRLASGNKCERCWKVLEEVGKNKNHETLCERCAEVAIN